MVNANPSTILVVDDHDFNLKLVAYMLEDAGYVVRTAMNGVEALASVDALLPDLLVLDVMMPVMDGFEVLKRLKADPKTHSIPVLLLTALSDDESRERGLSYGASHFITKPTKRLELLALVGETLKRSA